MSPPYDANPDRRPLPADWITQYDPNYDAWFYVNTATGITTWNHPLGPPERKTYPPPAVPPPNNNYAGGYSAATGQGSYPSQGGGNGYPQPSGGYGVSGGAEHERKGLGGLLGRLRPGQHDGGFGGGGGGYASQQQQPQVVYAQQQQPPKGSGMGKVALAAGAGLLGGAVLTEVLEHDDDRAYEEGYDEGRDDNYGGFDGGFDGGDNFGGGDFFLIFPIPSPLASFITA